jgi:hypothetical protein
MRGSRNMTRALHVDSHLFLSLSRSVTGIGRRMNDMPATLHSRSNTLGVSNISERFLERECRDGSQVGGPPAEDTNLIALRYHPLAQPRPQKTRGPGYENFHGRGTP